MSPGRPDRSRWRHTGLASAGLAGLLGLVGQLSALGLLATSAWLLTRASLRPPILTLSVAIAAVRLFALLRGLGRYGERLAGHDAALRVLARLRVFVYRRLETLVPGGLGSIREGDALARVVGDVDAVLDLLVGAALPVVTGLVSAAAAVGLVALLLPWAAVVLGCGLVLAGIALPALALVLGRRVAGQLGARRAEVTDRLVETLRGAADLVAFAAVPQATGALERAESGVTSSLRRQALVQGAGRGGGAALAGVTLAGVLAVGLRALGPTPGGHPALSGVELAVLAFATLAGFDSLAPLPEALAGAGAALGSVARLRALDQMTPPVRSPARPLDLPSGSPDLELDELSVRYPGQARWALQQLSLSVPFGKHVALVGPSGAGKSTVALVLLRFLDPEAGQFRVSGVDATRLDPEAVRALVAFAPQDPHVFQASLAANLRLARPDASDDQLLWVLESLGLGPWLRGLPEGLKTELGERGSRLSGGERQRLGIARAILARRPVLVLDEPTAHLDDTAEAQVRQAVLRAAKDASLLWITHRFSGLESFDEVLVLHDGRVLERSPGPLFAARTGALLEDPFSFGKLAPVLLPGQVQAGSVPLGWNVPPGPRSEEVAP